MHTLLLGTGPSSITNHLTSVIAHTIVLTWPSHILFFPFLFAFELKRDYPSFWRSVAQVGQSLFELRYDLVNEC